MSILSKLTGNIVPEITVEVDFEAFTLITHTHVPGIGDYEYATDLEDLYQLFKQRLESDWANEEADDDAY